MPVTENTWTDGHLSLLVIKDIDDDVTSDEMDDLSVKVFFSLVFKGAILISIRMHQKPTSHKRVQRVSKNCNR